MFVYLQMSSKMQIFSKIININKLKYQDMKKRFLALLTAVACLTALTSCDEDLTDIFGSDDALGHITLTTSNAMGEQSYSNDMTIEFKSAICNVNNRTIEVDIDTLGVDFDTTLLNVNAGSIFVGVSGVDVTTNTANINWPICGINLRDTLTGNYVIDLPVDNFDFLEYIDTTSINSMITSGLNFRGRPCNLFAVAASRDEYYIGYSGSVNITAFEGAGTLVEGTLNNVRAVYITREQIEALLAMTPEERDAVSLSTTLPRITFNGTLSSLRANMTSVINRVNELDQVEVTK